MTGESLPEVPLTLPIRQGVKMEGLPADWAELLPED